MVTVLSGVSDALDLGSEGKMVLSPRGKIFYMYYLELKQLVPIHLRTYIGIKSLSDVLTLNIKSMHTYEGTFSK